MLVKKVAEGYEFVSHSSDGAFIITLSLTDKGKESLHTIPIGVPVEFEPLDLKKGTIKKAIGPARWKNFLRMKELSVATMFIDRHSKEFSNDAW